MADEFMTKLVVEPFIETLDFLKNRGADINA